MKDIEIIREALNRVKERTEPWKELSPSEKLDEVLKELREMAKE